MMRLTFFVVVMAWTLGGCLPNPQSEWTSSAGGSQRSTLDDPTIRAQSTPCPPGGGIVDFDWGSAFSFWSADDDHGVGGGGGPARASAHPSVNHGFGASSGERRASSNIGGGGGGGGGRRR